MSAALVVAVVLGVVVAGVRLAVVRRAVRRRDEAWIREVNAAWRREP